MKDRITTQFKNLYEQLYRYRSLKRASIISPIIFGLITLIVWQYSGESNLLDFLKNRPVDFSFINILIPVLATFTVAGIPLGAMLGFMFGSREEFVRKRLHSLQHILEESLHESIGPHAEDCDHQK